MSAMDSRRNDKVEANRYIRVKGFMLHYSAAGSGEPLMMLHGGGTWHYTFRHNIVSLSRHFRVITPDLPGHGYTYPLDRINRYDNGTVCNVLDGLLGEMGIKRCHLLGHSWGGGWAIDFAEKYPQRVARMVLIASSGIHHRDRLSWEMLKLPVIGRVLPYLVTRGMVKRGLAQAFAEPATVSREMIHAVYTPLTFSHVKQALHSFAKNTGWSEIEQKLPQIQCPALIIWGRKDRYINVRHGRQLAERIPFSQLEILEDCGHTPHEENPVAVNRLVTDFLRA